MFVPSCDKAVITRLKSGHSVRPLKLYRRSMYSCNRGDRLRQAEGASRAVTRSECGIAFVSKVKTEMMTVDAVVVDKAVRAIRENVKTGRIGGGEIFVCVIRDFVRIQTRRKGRCCYLGLKRLLSGINSLEHSRPL